MVIFQCIFSLGGGGGRIIPDPRSVCKSCVFPGGILPSSWRQNGSTIFWHFHMTCCNCPYTYTPCPQTTSSKTSSPPPALHQVLCRSAMKLCLLCAGGKVPIFIGVPEPTAAGSTCYFLSAGTPHLPCFIFNFVILLFLSSE